MAERFSLRAAVFAVLIQDGSVLLARRAGTGFMDGYYGLPSGHVDGNEPLTKAVIREAEEEVGIRLAASDLTFAHAMHRIYKDERYERPLEYLDFFFTASAWDGEPVIQETDKCDDLSWFALDALPENIISYIRTALEGISSGDSYSEVGWPEA